MSAKVIKFYTTWCGPCKIMTDFMNKVDLKGAEFVEIDAEAEPEIAKKYKVMSVPVLVFEKDGKEVERINGVVPAEAIQEKVNALC